MMALPVIRRRERAIPAQWSPFSEFEDLYDRMGMLLGSAFGEPTTTAMWTPLADLMETEDSYVVDVEVPGMSKDQIDIQMSGNEISISGELPMEEQEGKRAHRRSRRYGHFEYRTMLPGDVSPEKVSAKLEHGVLSVNIPKSAESKPRRISIS